MSSMHSNPPADPEKFALEVITSRMIPVLYEQTDRAILRKDVDGAIERINKRIAEGWTITRLSSLISVEEGDEHDPSGGLGLLVHMEKIESTA